MKNKENEIFVERGSKQQAPYIQIPNLKILQVQANVWLGVFLSKFRNNQ